MSNESSRPAAWEYIAYSYGKVLPASKRDWVRNDLVSKGAQRRTLVRVVLPTLILVAPLWLIPTMTAIHFGMSGILLFPAIYFTFAQDKVWRTHRLRQHGLSPDIIDEVTRKRDAHRIEAYHRNYPSTQGGTAHAS